MRIYCTECDEKAVIRSSAQQSKTVREVRCQCTDPECGHTFVMNVVFSHTISPSARALPKALRDAIRDKSPGQIRAMFQQVG